MTTRADGRSDRHTDPASYSGLGFERSLMGALLLAAGAAMAALIAAYGDWGGGPAVHARLDSPQAAGISTPAPSHTPLRISVSPVLSPTADFTTYGDLGRYLEGRLGRRVQMLRRRTYQEVGDLLNSGQADAAFVCTGLYLRLERDEIVSRLVVPHIEGRTTYQSLIIVPRESSTRDWRELRGKTIAFSDPLSNSGKLYPDYLVRTNGFEPDRFFARVIYMYGHDASIRAVARGLVDTAAVDSLVWETMEAHDPSVSGRTRVVHRSPPFGINPVVVRRGLAPDLAEALAVALIGMDGNVAGRRVLEAIGVSGFSRDLPVDYTLTEHMLDEVEPR